MKKIILLTALTLVTVVSGIAQATSNLIIFASDPTPFYAIVNGIRQNSEPQTNVKITGLTNNATHIKVVFSDGVTPDIEKQIYFESMNIEATMRIVNTKKGYKLRYFGEVAMGQAAVNPQQTQIVYQTVEAPATTNAIVEETTTTTTTTTTSGGNDGVVHSGAQENVNMNVSIGGVDMNMNVNVNDNGVHNDIHYSDNVETTYSTTTTTTTTTSNGYDDYNTTNTQPVQPIVYVQGYNGRTGCTPPLSDVYAIKSAIENEDFSDDKLMVAKQALRGKCMSVQNIITLADAFDFEDKKLDFAKYAYDSTYDVDNYYQVNKIFDFSSSKDELNEYLSNK